MIRLFLRKVNQNKASLPPPNELRGFRERFFVKKILLLSCAIAISGVCSQQLLAMENQDLKKLNIFEGDFNNEANILCLIIPKDKNMISHIQETYQDTQNGDYSHFQELLEKAKKNSSFEGSLFSHLQVILALPGLSPKGSRNENYVKFCTELFSKLIKNVVK